MAKTKANNPASSDKMTKKEAMKSLIATLNFYVEDNKKNLNENLKKLLNNYYYYFSWVGEAALEQDIKYGLLASLYDDIVEGTGTFSAPEDESQAYFYTYKKVYYAIKENKDFCLKAYNVRTSSTSELSNIKSTVEFKMRLEIIEMLTKFLKAYVKDTDLSTDELQNLSDFNKEIDNPY